MTSQPKRLAALYLGAVFFAGLALGVVSHWFYSARIAEADAEPQTAVEWRQRLLLKLDEELDLSPQQEVQVLAILNRIGERFHEIRDKVEPKFHELRQERAEQVMAVLTPEQQLKYKQMLKERKRRRKERHEDWWGKKEKK